MRFYCVETICALCGVVIAWAKFAKSESPTNILAFLQSVFPTEDSRPDYICIDKGCAVLHTSISNGSWDQTWQHTTQFIVDSYHYINHRTSDYIWKKWCNPALLDGSAPNLVIVEKDRDENNYYKRVFNTQVSNHQIVNLLCNHQYCRHVNSSIHGLEGLKIYSREWFQVIFLHTMLFYHTRHVIEKHNRKEGREST